MTEILLPHEGERIRAQFQELGHVGVRECFDPSLTTSARMQLDALIKRQSYYDVTNSLVETVKGFNKDRQPTLGTVIDAIHDQVDELGEELWPENPNYHMQHLEMEPGKEGAPHRDSPILSGAVAITNLQGNSRLVVVEGDGDYAIGNGDVVFLDAARRLLHYGIAGDDGKRIGLVVAVKK